jgi:hypothetical protein
VFGGGRRDSTRSLQCAKAASYDAPRNKLPPFEETRGSSLRETRTLGSGCIGPRAMPVQAVGDEAMEGSARFTLHFKTSSIHLQSEEDGVLIHFLVIESFWHVLDCMYHCIEMDHFDNRAHPNGL